MLNVARWLWAPWHLAARELLDTLEATLAWGHHPIWSASAVMLATLGAWFVYVPVHELLHALGCVLAGGSVEELWLARLYGGGWLEAAFPFVRAGGEYAGRLTKFDTGGSDLTYLVTDFAPFLLTILAAFPLLRAARRRQHPLLFGPGALLTAAPLISLTGDYYEMGAILVSAAIGGLTGDSIGARAMRLRGDDLLRLVSDFNTVFPGHRPVWALAVAASAAVGCLLAGATLSLGRRWANLWLRPGRG